MNSSYSGCTFKLILPRANVYNDNLTISYKFNYNPGNREQIVFYRATCIDRVNQKYETTDGQKLFPLGMNHISDTIRFISNQKIWINGATLTMEFLSDRGNKTIIQFLLNSNNPTKLLDVSNTAMSQTEKKHYISIIKEGAALKQIPLETKDEFHSNNSSTQINQAKDVIPGLDKYLAALRTEKLFLMQGGGKNYKVTNGRLLSKKNVYLYLFDLEAELYLADDAPIKISTGVESVPGIVLICEDFQIIVQLESGLGDRIGSAVMSVEPWKLLESLENRLNHTISLGESRMINALLKEGPSLSTTIPIDKIPKGQDEVIRKAMKNPVTIVWGPPGTGKTHTMSEMAIRFIDKGYHVLIVSHSNVSVDGVAKKMDELLRQQGKHSLLKAGSVLRYGYVRDEILNRNQYVSSFYYAVTKNPTLHKKLDSLQNEYDQVKRLKGLNDSKIIALNKEIRTIHTEIREQERYCVSQAKVVATTISKVIADKLFEEKKFDVVMFDEVSMAYVLQVAAAATFAKKHLICVGDFMQLAPIAQSKAKDILCQDIFTHLGINQNGQPYYHPWLVMLDEQRRMEPRIAAFANKYVYKGLLRNHPSVLKSREKIVASELFPGEAINLIDLTSSYCAASKNADNSRYNILSAVISFCVALKTEKSENIGDVSIITPYAAQTRLIRALVLDYRQNGNTELRCATVHQFQGSESDVIIFDAVESYPSKKPGWLMGKDFNSILRLINVAVTRAKGKLITVANVTFWNNNYKGTGHTFFRLVNYLKEKGNIIQHKDKRSLEMLIQQLSIKGGPQFYSDSEQSANSLKRDIEHAHNKIVISFPSGNIDPSIEKQLFAWLEKKNEAGVQILIKCNEYQNLPVPWKKYSCGTDNAIFPIIMIDDCITWYGVPTAPWKFVDREIGYTAVCHIVCRIKGEHTAEMIRSLCDLEYRTSEGNKSALLPKSETISNSESPLGLASYVAKNIKCPHCKHNLVMTRGRSGKTILWCKKCKTTHLLSPDDVNHYMSVNHIKCSQHHCDMEAKIGKYGLYIHCDAGHYVKPEEI